MCTKKELQFSIFLIYNLAEKWQKSPADVYKILNETHILDDYIFVCYDTLHTLGTEYLVEDITEYAREKKLELRQAMDIYYRSRLAKQIEQGAYGIENMDYKYLVQDLIENEPELFQN